MSLPKSRILTNKQGLTASAEFHNNSPEQNTVVNVNVHQPAEKIDTPERPQTPTPTSPSISINDVNNPYAAIDSGEVNYTSTRSVETAKESVQDVESIIKSKDNIINAYALMLDIIENNPLLVNKYVVAEIDSLTLLISYLTEAERVDIQESLDIDCSCSGSVKYIPIEKIYITKKGETQNFKYQYPNANKILDDHRISVKFVIDRSLQ